MTRFTGYVTGLVVTLFLVTGVGFAKSSVRIPAELAGTQQVMKLLRRVNVPRTEQRAQQGAVDILEFKSQLYTQSPLLRPGVAALNGTAKAPSQPASYKRQIPGHRRFPAKY